MAQTPPKPGAPRTYPHVDGIEDWHAQQSIRLLWDQVFGLQDRVGANESSTSSLGATQASHAQLLQTAQASADEALSIAQGLLGAGGTSQGSAPGSGGGATGGGGPTSGPGSPGEPIVPMSADPVTAEDQVKRSLAYWGRTDYGYWSAQIHIPSMTPWQGGDSNWYVGWDAYFEARASPGDPGSADHSLLPLPAVHQDPVPSGYPTGGWT